jgi:NAD(P)-dependent dehydrogenase (short-subunit alcohol dehydrogenase family)
MRKMVFVTGADRGVGFGLVKQLVERDFFVFAGRYMKDWTELDRIQKEFPDQVRLVDLDIGSDDSVRAAATIVKSETDKLDILINNGAILGEITAKIEDELDFEQMQQVFNITALGALRMSNALIPLILNSDHKLIVNVSSEAGSVTNCWRDGWFGYCMAKTAVNMHSNIVHNDIYKKGGQVLVFHPGWVKSYMSGKFNDEAEITSDESATGIIHNVLQHQKYQAEKPTFIDYKGTPMPW